MSKYARKEAYTVKYCPYCFLTNELTKLELSNEEYNCSVCGYTFVWPSTLISEDTVRTYVKEHPEFNHWLTLLEG